MTNHFEKSKDYYTNHPSSWIDTINSNTLFEANKYKGSEIKFVPSNRIYTPISKNPIRTSSTRIKRKPVKKSTLKPHKRTNSNSIYQMFNSVVPK